MAEDKPANHRTRDRRGSADRNLEEMLRQIGTDLLDEPVPERLRRVLRPKGESDEDTVNSSRVHPPSRDDGAQRRDDEPSG